MVAPEARSSRPKRSGVQRLVLAVGVFVSTCLLAMAAAAGWGYWKLSHIDRVNVDLSASPIELLVEWFNPENGSIYTGETFQGGDSSQSFSAPFSGDAVLYIHAVEETSATPTGEASPSPAPQPTKVDATSTPASGFSSPSCFTGLLLVILLLVISRYSRI